MTSLNDPFRTEVWRYRDVFIGFLIVTLTHQIVQWHRESRRQLESTYIEVVNLTTKIHYVKHIKPCTGTANQQETTNYVANNEAVRVAWAEMLSSRQSFLHYRDLPTGNTLIEDVANRVRKWCSNNVGRADGSGISQLDSKGKY